MMEAMARKDSGEGPSRRSAGNYSGKKRGTENCWKRQFNFFSNMLGGSDHKRPKNDGPVRNS